MLWRLLFRFVVDWLPAETAHSLGAALLRTLMRPALVRRAARRLLAPRDPRLAVDALGLRFPTPLGVAAGLDKEADWFEALGAIGFGFVEVGTITAVAQPGNPKPRVRRLTAERALLNSMGFPNPGAAVAARRLAARTGPTIVGANVGKSNVVPVSDAATDYREALRALAPHADYVALNVSSPNTPGLRAMQAVEPLRALLHEVRDELGDAGRPVPVLLKIAPDLADDELDAIADLALAEQLDGIIAVNTTVDRSVLGPASAAAVEGLPGGVSGAPLKVRAVEVLRRLRARCGDRLVLVSAGGVETADDVCERVLAGATLVQAYTGFVYGGPLWPRRVNRELARRVEAAGAASVSELVGPEQAPARRAGAAEPVEVPRLGRKQEAPLERASREWS